MSHLYQPEDKMSPVEITMPIFLVFDDDRCIHLYIFPRKHIVAGS